MRFAFLLLSTCLPMIAADGRTAALLPPDPLSSFSLSGQSSDHLTIVRVEGQSFGRAWHVQTPATAANPWDIRLIGKPLAAVVKNDVLVAKFWLRTANVAVNQPASTRFVVEQNAAPYTKSANWPVMADNQWRKVEIPFTMSDTYRADAYTIQLWLSYGPQEIEIGGLSVDNLGQGIAYRDLGLRDYPYAGAGPDASWRANASQRIEKIRKTDVVVIVNDDQGRPLPQTAVHVKMTRHAFGFGSAVDADTLLQSGADGDKYREFIKKNFNKAVLENDLKWPEYERNRGRAVSALDWLRSQGLTDLRGHNLVWPDWQYLPADAQSMKPYPEALRGRIRSHISDVVSNTKGKVTEWDVLNEAVSNQSVQQLLGDAEMAEWFRYARAADAGVRLYINDYSILDAGGSDLAQQDAYWNLIRNLGEAGAPVDGIGLQAHLDTNLTSPERLVSVLDRFAGLGKPLEVTEFDVDTPDEAAQASYTRDFLTACFSHPAVNSILLWGFWEGRHWKPNAALVRRDWTMRPNGKAWQDMVFGHWWTDAAGKTDGEGAFRVRGFLGSYDIEVEVNGQKSVRQVTLVPGQPNYVVFGRQNSGTIDSGAIVNAASYARGAVAPGQIVTLFGADFGPGTLTQVPSDPVEGMPLAAGDTAVWFDNVAAPVVYAAKGQVSVIVPYAVRGTTTVQIEYRGVRTNPVRLPVADAAPGIFTLAAGTGQAAAINANGSRNTSETPVERGSLISLYLTGAGRLTPALADGKTPTGPDYPQSVQAMAVRFGGVPGRIDFAGLVFPGVMQVNVQVPPQAPVGDAVPVQVQIGPAASQAGVTVAVR